MNQAHPKGYRLNVGVVVFNQAGKVWLGRRADGKGERIWQFPQGGVDPGEELLAAAKRELFEETGIASAAPIRRARGWITYDFPEGFTGSKSIKGYAGQTQAWYAFRFDGQDSEIDLKAHHVAEFDAWRWADLAEAPDLVVGFKREAYLKVVEAFKSLADASGERSSDRGAMLMVHGVGCTGRVFEPMAEAFRLFGWSVEAPTLKADLRLRAAPPAALGEVSLQDYVAEAAGWAEAIKDRTGTYPVLVGHSMGGLIVQKLLEGGLGRAGVLLTPAPPAGVKAPIMASVAITFANILFAGTGPGKSYKVWRTGFDWGVLNCVAKARHADIYAEAVFDSGRVYQDLKSPGTGDGSAVIDETKITVPILTIAGGQDRATPASWVKATADKYAKIGGAFLEYPEHAHWIIDEPGSDQVVADIDGWLEASRV